MAIQYPGYDNSIASLACSILKEFHIKPPGSTMELCDILLQKPYKNIILILLDGMGKNILDLNLDKSGFFNFYLKSTYSSVFPPTTVAATTSALTGLHPSGHGWLGWDCYYKEIDKNVTVFSNTESGTVNPAAKYNVARRYCPYDSIIDLINQNGGQAYYGTPFEEPYPGNFEEICDYVEGLCKKNGKKYIYCYCPEPDSTMHTEGISTPLARQVVQRLEEQVEQLCRRIKDSLVIVTADHGHIDSKNVSITDYPRITECLIRKPSIEPRALNLFVKQGMEHQLKTEFAKEFGDKFLLLTKEEVKAGKLFGIGKVHERFDEMLGDYLAVAVGDLSIFNSREEQGNKVGMHAGLTKDEMVIPFIAIDTNTLGQEERE